MRHFTIGSCVAILMAANILAPATSQQARASAAPARRVHPPQPRCARLAVKPTIRCVFGRYGEQAVAVAKCESTWHAWARNGQYLGLFQMGAHERARYGHGSTALAQTRAAHRYFMQSGRDWSPWACKWAARQVR